MGFLDPRLVWTVETDRYNDDGKQKEIVAEYVYADNDVGTLNSITLRESWGIVPFYTIGKFHSRAAKKIQCTADSQVHFSIAQGIDKGEII